MLSDRHPRDNSPALRAEPALCPTPPLRSSKPSSERTQAVLDVFMNDLNTVERGKRIDRDSMARVCEAGMLLPGSLYSLDVLGGTIESTGLGFDEGDADRPCLPVPGSIVPVPWQADGVAQAQVSMYEHDGRAFFGDPRHVLARVLERFQRLNLSPVIAIEYEFYLVDHERTAQGQPQPPTLAADGPARVPHPDQFDDGPERLLAAARADRQRVPRAGHPDDDLARRVRPRAVRSEPAAPERRARGLRPGAALQARGQEPGARPRLRCRPSLPSPTATWPVPACTSMRACWMPPGTTSSNATSRRSARRCAMRSTGC